MNEKSPSMGVTDPTVLLRLMTNVADPFEEKNMELTIGKNPGTSVGVRTMTGNEGYVLHVPGGKITR